MNETRQTNNSTGPKRTKHERQRDIAEVAERWADGWTQQEITAWLNANRTYQISRTAVLRDCRAAEQIWMDRAVEAIDRRKARELAKLERVERKANEAFERSKDEFTKTEVVRTGKGDERDGQARARVTKETRDGNPAFLGIVIQCVRERCQILGINAPAKTEISGPEGGPVPLQEEKPALDIETIKQIFREELLAEANT